MCVNCGGKVLVVSFGWSTYCPSCGAYARDIAENFVTGDKALQCLRLQLNFAEDAPTGRNMSKSDLQNIIEHYKENHGYDKTIR